MLARTRAKAHKAGVPMLTAHGFRFRRDAIRQVACAQTEIFVERLGFTPAEALRAATEVAMADGCETGG